MHVSPLQRDFDAIFKHILVTYYLRLPTYLPTYDYRDNQNCISDLFTQTALAIFLVDLNISILLC